VKRRLLDALAGAVLVSVVFVALLVLRPFGRQLVLQLYLLALTGLLMVAIVGALPARGRSAFEAALRRPQAEERRPPQLERVERTVTLGVATSFDFHARLRPLLREVAAARLATARGVELDSPAGRAALGEDTWELLRPDREPPADRYAPGPDEQRLRGLVEFLETL
jgi:hypothetical protein